MGGVGSWEVVMEVEEEYLDWDYALIQDYADRPKYIRIELAAFGGVDI